MTQDLKTQVNNGIYKLKKILIAFINAAGNLFNLFEIFNFLGVQ